MVSKIQITANQNVLANPFKYHIQKVRDPVFGEEGSVTKGSALLSDSTMWKGSSDSKLE